MSEVFRTKTANIGLRATSSGVIRQRAIRGRASDALVQRDITRSMSRAGTERLAKAGRRSPLYAFGPCKLIRKKVIRVKDDADLPLRHLLWAEIFCGTGAQRSLRP